MNRDPIATRTGIVIGGAWTPPPAHLSDDARAVQRWLLTTRQQRIHDLGERVALWVSTITAAGLLALLFGGRL
jgi:hypothetical protein